MAKILVTSPDALINNETDNWFPGVESALDLFCDSDENNRVVIVSRNRSRLLALPSKYMRVVVPSKSRGSGRTIEYVLGEYQDFSLQDVMILGANNADMFTAFNSKVLLFTAAYARNNSPDSRIHTQGYGLKITEPTKLSELFKYFLDIQNPWFYRLEVDEVTTLLSLTNANTYTVDADTARTNDRFRECLKDNRATYQNYFMIYSLLSMQSDQTIGLFQNIDSWGVYPSSSVDSQPILEEFKELFRINYKSRFKKPILERINDSQVRHQISKDERISSGCDNQFQTIRLNPHAKNYIEGKNVCIIDDFTTYGTSCETARTFA